MVLAPDGAVWGLRADSRDAHGRFLKGTTGNPKGRPTKLSMVESADFALFKGTMVEVDSVRGRKRILTREGAIQERLYASAMKGNVQAQIFLSRKFEAFTMATAEAEALPPSDLQDNSGRRPPADRGRSRGNSYVAHEAQP